MQDHALLAVEPEQLRPGTGILGLERGLGIRPGQEDGAPGLAPPEVEGLPDRGPPDEGPETVLRTQSRPGPPDCSPGLLGGILGELAVEEDPEEQPLEAPSELPDQALDIRRDDGVAPRAGTTGPVSSRPFYAGPVAEVSDSARETPFSSLPLPPGSVPPRMQPRHPGPAEAPPGGQPKIPPPKDLESRPERVAAAAAR